MIPVITIVSSFGVSSGVESMPALATDFSRLRTEGEHVGPDRSVGSQRALGWIELTFLVDEPLEPGPEASMCRTDHDLRVIRGPRRQAADPTPDCRGALLFCHYGEATRGGVPCLRARTPSLHLN
jgi:hypothetical protein